MGSMSMNKMIAFIVAFAGLLPLTPSTGRVADSAADILAATGLNGGQMLAECFVQMGNYLFL